MLNCVKREAGGRHQPDRTAGGKMPPFNGSQLSAARAKTSRENKIWHYYVVIDSPPSLFVFSAKTNAFALVFP